MLFEEDFTRVDENIKPFIRALNRVIWIKTASSCEGHEGSLYSEPYISFYCDTRFIKDFCLILNEIDRAISEKGLNIKTELFLVHDREEANNQTVAPQGWLALGLIFRNLDKKGYHKKIFFERISKLFEELV